MSVGPVKNDAGRIVAYRARWRDPEGKQKKQTFRLKRDADAHFAAMTTAKSSGAYIDITSATTLAEYAAQWIDGRVYRESSATGQEVRLRLHIEGTRLGGMRLVKIKKSDVQAWILDRSAVLGADTLRGVLGFVRSVLSAAVEDGLIARSPAAGRFSLPEPEHVEVVPLTIGEVRSLSKAVEPRKKAIVVVQAATGLRVGELLALRLADVDFLRRMVFVREQVHPRNRTRTPLKTRYSSRDVPLPQTAIDALAAHLAEYPANAEGYLFTTPRGLSWNHDSLNKALVNAAEELGLPHTTSHDLRHHYASVLLDAGESVIVVARRLGHKDAQLVLRVYGHLMAATEDRTRRAVDAAWSAEAEEKSALRVPEGASSVL